MGLFAVFALKGIVEPSARLGESANDCEIVLPDPSTPKKLCETRGRLGVECEYQYAGCCAVDPVHRKDVLTNLVPKQLETRRFARAPCVAVNEHTARFIDCDETSITI